MNIEKTINEIYDKLGLYPLPYPVTPPVKQLSRDKRRSINTAESGCETDEEDDGWFRHHYTDERNPLRYSRWSHIDPIEFPLPKASDPATLEDDLEMDTKAESGAAVITVDPLSLDYSILHSPTYKKTQRKAQAQDLRKARGFRVVTRRSEKFPMLQRAWRLRESGPAVGKGQAHQPPNPEEADINPNDSVPYPSPRSSSEPSHNPKRFRTYSGYELWKEAGDNSEAKRQVSEVLHKRCDDRTNHLPDPFVSPLDRRTIIRKWLDDVEREDGDMVSEGSSGSWHTTSSNLDETGSPDGDMAMDE